MRLEQYEPVVALWQAYNITSVADLDKYLDSFRILFGFHAGRLENEEITYHDTREIFANGTVAISPKACREPKIGLQRKLAHDLRRVSGLVGLGRSEVVESNRAGYN